MIIEDHVEESVVILARAPEEAEVVFEDEVGLINLVFL